MNSKQSPTTLIWQNPARRGSHVYRLIQHHLDSSELIRFRVAVAYVSWGGLSLIADSLEKFLRKGKSLETIYGIENGVTTPDALLYSVYLQRQFANYKIAKSYRWNYIDSEFHPKYFEFEYPDHAVCVVGSGNLTGGGLAANHELATAIVSPIGSPLRRHLREWWSHYLSEGKTITPKMIRAMNATGRFGTERSQFKSHEKINSLRLRLPRAKKPLFQHILDDVGSSSTRHDVLADGDALTEKPSRLYLEILQNETGGGHQIQLPVATLGTFFGVGTGQSKKVHFVFPTTSENVDVQLTHFENNTHRVRLRPLKDVPRPAIVVFERTQNSDHYDCRIVPPSRYASTLRQRCREQTRQDSRRWGFVD